MSRGYLLLFQFAAMRIARKAKKRINITLSKSIIIQIRRDAGVEGRGWWRHRQLCSLFQIPASQCASPRPSWSFRPAPRPRTCFGTAWYATVSSSPVAPPRAVQVTNDRAVTSWVSPVAGLSPPFPGSSASVLYRLLHRHGAYGQSRG